jgi:hypothetical protein
MTDHKVMINVTKCLLTPRLLDGCAKTTHDDVRYDGCVKLMCKIIARWKHKRIVGVHCAQLRNESSADKTCGAEHENCHDEARGDSPRL